MNDSSETELGVGELAESEEAPFPTHALEQEESAFAELRRSCEDFVPDPDESIDLYTEERLALRHLYPNTLVDLGRAGVIKMRVFREDGSSYFLPGGEEAES
ncbi:MAG: hypothetical protein F4Y27_11420 [Acidimicrobiaceae bacterium]|nr:hypothetical protein [Acidimicrobiaceae bacterium]MXW76650.1 hypothetical protein [Acidimicrobiaceae bacterium]MYA75272.1 hypothetical protein [Acidimicrobiaceae bacterium]MYD08260.1 hypothetical protein [Acidimicrobiaceae bacterium]MYG55080.1 hypothetical protein [Acidimicrobiaceae bacterium]